MEPRLANTWRLTVNEKKFIETALQSDLRIDGRRPFEYRKISIKFGRQAFFPPFPKSSIFFFFFFLFFFRKISPFCLFLGRFFMRLLVIFREDGSTEVQLGQTHVMGFVTAQLVQPYKDRPNEGTLSIFTEFSPMADPSFEPGRPGEAAVELGRVIDRGLR
jgi:exosome complex component RRP45